MMNYATRGQYNRVGKGAQRIARATKPQITCWRARRRAYVSGGLMTFAPRGICTNESFQWNNSSPDRSTNNLVSVDNNLATFNTNYPTSFTAVRAVLLDCISGRLLQILTQEEVQRNNFSSGLFWDYNLFQRENEFQLFVKWSHKFKCLRR